MIDIRRLQLFVAVAEELHFGRAAARVGMAQPPFSQQIRRLEQELGVDLLVRTSRHVSLTNAGSELLVSARDLIARRDQIVGRVQRTAIGEAGTLRLGFAASSAIGILPRIIRRFREALPDVLLELDDRDGTDVAAAIRTRALDVAVVRAPFEADQIMVELLHSEAFVAVLPAAHRLATRASVTPADLAGIPLILFPRPASPGLHDTIIGMCIGAGFSPVIVQEANAWLSIMGLVDSGFGVTIAPKSAASICPSTIACVPVVGTSDRAQLAMAYLRDLPVPLVIRFREIARSCIDQQD
ncbi:LysR family transcriptional regulator [Sphingomonas sp. CFBP 13720]|uniref:LysR family transcriptional regulator n=1 Tax=Sphingomonas sp. CFBP 13720 TaxID=2775302 RepID=UPI00177C5491|nr:LysR family transcriptional regulator [Sphingomonas sp. CFBP 13720]MBD8680124.1 LysR family transcriptional regulator [Sphingomonas sp. CFBP 13720]